MCRVLPALAFLVAVLGFLLGLSLPALGAEGRWLSVMASAYCPCPVCCGVRAVGLTADGTKVSAEPYGIAAHPRYLPYGSTVTIPAGQGYLDASRSDRRFRVDDTGGIVRRRTEQTADLWIDLRFRSHAAALRWGIRRITIYVEEP